MNAQDPRVSVVVLTHERPQELERTLQRLQALPERPALIVVNNGSAPAAAEVVRRFEGVTLVQCPRNLGAAGRNLGVARVRTPYVAFCDDDTWWEPGSLSRAAAVLDAHPRLAVLNARVLVGPENRVDPACECMAASPLDSRGLPGPRLVSFMAGAVVMRVQAFREAGSYEPRFFLGAEEVLLGQDLMAAGWDMAYVASVCTHHHPSPARDRRARALVTTRNRLWLAWLRLPWPLAWHETRKVWRDGVAQGVAGAALRAALAGLPWVLARRRVLPPPVVELIVQVHGGPPPARRRVHVTPGVQR
ncbi:glycosyltransferase family 2 protein [Azohydromonas caseinilytica]|uniref:Glycosyltransferase n=1 Tax=Azohydromonas caseinilytica TaxID=2728836 RepID=A0A848F2G9_9BURK|nr:glycosyltransferase [Azohydromonas caseinilytica]NML14247.1 glycosyltransferase [Azohydromonas caseinilytica]